MIGRLYGKIDEIRNDTLLLNIHGICFIIFLKEKCLETLNIGEKLSLEIYTSVTENGIKLYGFFNINELQLFEILLKIPGISSKIAISILDQVDMHTLIDMIYNKDHELLINIKGIGKKIAMRMISELSENSDFNKMILLNKSKDINVDKEKTNISITQKQIMRDAISTLHALGYKQYNAEKLVNSAMQKKTEYDDVGSLIKDALNINIDINLD